MQLAIQTIGGLSVGVNPSSAYNNPAAVLPASQPNPVPVVVRCSNVPLGTQIFLNARSAVGQTAASSGYNNSGTLASSAATIAINLPRGTGILMAQAVISSGQGLSAQTSPNTPEHAVVEAATAKTQTNGMSASAPFRDLPLAVTGWRSDGERLVAMEVVAQLGGPQQTVYVTESGKRYPISSK